MTQTLQFHQTHGCLIDKEVGFNIDVGLKELRQINTRIMGGGSSQGYAAFKLLEHYIAYENPHYVVEIGSQKGGLSVFLGTMACASEQFLFHTFEINKNRDWYNREVEGVGHWFEKMETISSHCKSFEGNIFSEEIFELIKNISSQCKTLIICDGGDKIKELEMYSKILKPGDAIMAHDFPDENGRGEITDNDVDYTFLKKLEPWNKRFEENGTLFKMFTLR